MTARSSATPMAASIPAISASSSTPSAPMADAPTAARRFSKVAALSAPFEVRKASTGAACVSDRPTPSITAPLSSLRPVVSSASTPSRPTLSNLSIWRSTSSARSGRTPAASRTPFSTLRLLIRTR